MSRHRSDENPHYDRRPLPLEALLPELHDRAHLGSALDDALLRHHRPSPAAAHVRVLRPSGQPRS